MSALLPMAFRRLVTRKEMTPSSTRNRLLLVALGIFRNMLAPVPGKPPGTSEGRHQRAGRACALRSGQTFDVVLTDIEIARHERLEFAEIPRRPASEARCRSSGCPAGVPAAIDRGRQAGFHDYVAKIRSVPA